MNVGTARSSAFGRALGDTVWDKHSDVILRLKRLRFRPSPTGDRVQGRDSRALRTLPDGHPLRRRSPQLSQYLLTPHTIGGREQFKKQPFFHPKCREKSTITTITAHLPQTPSRVPAWRSQARGPASAPQPRASECGAGPRGPEPRLLGGLDVRVGEGSRRPPSSAACRCG